MTLYTEVVTYLKNLMPFFSLAQSFLIVAEILIAQNKASVKVEFLWEVAAK